MKRNAWAAGTIVMGVACCGAGIWLSEKCPGDPRFACGSPAGITGLAFWGLAVSLLIGGIGLGVASWRASAAAALVIAVWVAAMTAGPPGSFETAKVVVTVGLALVLGGLLRLWAVALIPVLVLGVVPLGGNEADADGQSAWVYAAIDSVVILLVPFLVSGLIATAVRWRSRYVDRPRSQRPAR